MTRQRVVHLVDDTTAGGVMRVLDHITTSSDLARTADHSLRLVNRHSIALGRIDADVIVSHLSISWRGLPMLLALRAANPRTSLVHVEHSYTESFVAINVAHRGRFATLLRTSYALFDRVVAVSKAQGRWLSKRGYVRADALEVIQSCTDMSAFRAISRTEGPVRIIGAIGRLDRQKGFDTLITAFLQCDDPDLALHIYGEGSEEDALRELADGDPRICFKGFAPDPTAAIAAVDAVAMPSRWEAYGLVAIEALSAGRALLVSDVDGLIDHVPHGAQVVPLPSVSAWSHAISHLNVAAMRRPIAIAVHDSSILEARFANRWETMLASFQTDPYAEVTEAV